MSTLFWVGLTGFLGVTLFSDTPTLPSESMLGEFPFGDVCTGQKWILMRIVLEKRSMATGCSVAHWRAKVRDAPFLAGIQAGIPPGVDSPFFSAIVLFNNQLFPQGFRRFSRKQDPWKERGSYP